MKDSLSIITKTTKDTLELGKQMSRYLYPGLTVHLYGNLGAGKTVLIRGIAEGFDFNAVRSPSFTLINEYQTPIPIAHVDLYRLQKGQDCGLALDEYSISGYILLVEWPERLSEIPEDDLWILRIDVLGEELFGEQDSFENPRNISVRAIGEKARQRLDKLSRSLLEDVKS